MSIARRIAAIAYQMLPSLDLVFAAGIRATIGGVALAIATAFHGTAVSEWLQFGGRLFVVLAAWGIVVHAEGVFVKHAAAKVRIVLGLSRDENEVQK